MSEINLRDSSGQFPYPGQLERTFLRTVKRVEVESVPCVDVINRHGGMAALIVMGVAGGKFCVCGLLQTDR